MDKGDIAILIAVMSACFTAYQAWEQRRLRQNDDQKMKRKPLAMEVTLSPVRDRPGWTCAELVFRNTEPHTAEVTRIWTTGRYARLMVRGKSRPDGFGGAELVDDFDPANAGQSIDMHKTVGPDVEIESKLQLRPTVLMQCYIHGQVTRQQIKFDWRWKDDTPI